MNVLYSIKSARLQDIKLPEGATVRKLRDILSSLGYDVNNAHISIRRAGAPELYGSLLDHVLDAQDFVQFRTRKVQLPNTIAEAKAAAAATAAGTGLANGNGRIVTVGQEVDGSIKIVVR